MLQANGVPFGLAVDEINDTEEIVVKPLSPHLKHLDAFAGTTIMGDGAVSLILDVIGLARLGGAVHQSDGSKAADKALEDSNARKSESMQSMLVCRVGDQRVGIPLSEVSRLEELDRASIERAGGREVIQYRNRLLQLIRVGDILGIDGHDTESESIPVLVHEGQGAIFGLVVDEIVDVFEADLKDAEPCDQEGLTMSGVVGEHVTDMLDLEAMITAAIRPQLALVGGAS